MLELKVADPSLVVFVFWISGSPNSMTGAVCPCTDVTISSSPTPKGAREHGVLFHGCLYLLRFLSIFEIAISYRFTIPGHTDEVPRELTAQPFEAQLGLLRIIELGIHPLRRAEPLRECHSINHRHTSVE
jgi:hypothetical protein